MLDSFGQMNELEILLHQVTTGFSFENTLAPSYPQIRCSDSVCSPVTYTALRDTRVPQNCFGQADVTVFKKKKTHMPVRTERMGFTEPWIRSRIELPSILPVTLCGQPVRQSCLLLGEVHSSRSAFL